MINLKYLVLFIPFVFSYLTKENSILSFSISWLGSIFILWYTLSKLVNHNGSNFSLRTNFMHPLFLTQFVFVGYMCFTSMFFFLNSLGYTYFVYDKFSIINYRSLEYSAICQRYYNLAHIAYAIGLTIVYNTKKHRTPHYVFNIDNSYYSPFFIKSALIFSIIALILPLIPGLNQFAIKFKDLGYISATIAFVYSIKEFKTYYILISGAIFSFNLLSAFYSGWKEPIVVTIIIMAGYLYPLYKKTVTLTFLPIFFFTAFVLPSFNNVYRTLSWTEGVDSELAAQEALAQVQSGTVDISETNWMFLTNRLSEISMFIEYVDKVPSKHDYYGLEIISNSFRFLLPRFFWPDKPDVETHVMERVYELGVVTKGSGDYVSAKPPIVVDAYLSGGIIAIFFILVGIGALTMWIANLCEKLLGGYEFGIAWFYTGLFQILWRGNCLEFFVNSVFWGVITLYIIFFVLRTLNILVPNK